MKHVFQQVDNDSKQISKIYCISDGNKYCDEEQNRLISDGNKYCDEERWREEE